MTTSTFFLIAGEASGDSLGARLMRALKHKLDGKVSFRGIGGPQMQAEGLELLFPHTELMHFGVVEVVRHIPRLLRRIDQTAREIVRVHPDAVISIDSPDFCFRVAKKVRKLSNGVHIPLIHYVAPTVWAWRPGRAKKIARFLDHLLAVLPFEPPYFLREGLPCTFVGHSIVEGEAANGSGAIFRSRHNIEPRTPLLTVLPGSRTGEVTRLLPIFKQTVILLQAQHPDLQIVIPTVPHLHDRVATEIKTWPVRSYFVEGERDKYDAFAASHVALACSGTVALELALARLPAVIAYKINNLTAFLYRRFIRTPYANLVNIMHRKKVVPEFLQENCTPEKLAQGIDRLLCDDVARQAQIAALASTAEWLGQGQFVPSECAAETVLAALHQKQPPAILQVLPALVTGGVERGTVEIAAALVKAGYRALVASSGGPMAREVENAGGIHISLPLKSKNPFTMWRNIARLREVIRQHKVDLVHARSRAPAWSAQRAARDEKVPFVTTFHSAYGAGSKTKRLYNSVMARGQRVIAISDFVASYAESTYGVGREIMRTIPRGVDIDTFDPVRVSAERVDTLRRAWNLTDNIPVILMPGRITRWKGQSVLIEALAKLSRRDFACVIVGGGKDTPYGNELRDAIGKSGLSGNVMMVDICRDMAAAYKLADMVIVPSTRPEGFGRVVIEAQAMGKPVLASDHGGAKETVIQGQTGWLVTPGDADALAHALRNTMMMTPAQRDAHAARARAHMLTNYTTAQMAAKTLAVYRELLHTEPDGIVIPPAMETACERTAGA
jgi:lipid-A-disaccharide synthase